MLAEPKTGQFHFRGDLCEYMGATSTVRWAPGRTLYEFRYVDGRRAGETGDTFNPPIDPGGTKRRAERIAEVRRQHAGRSAAEPTANSDLRALRRLVPIVAGFSAVAIIANAVLIVRALALVS